MYYKASVILHVSCYLKNLYVNKFSKKTGYRLLSEQIKNSIKKLTL